MGETLHGKYTERFKRANVGESTDHFQMKSNLFFLEHILDQARFLLAAVEGISKDGFLKDRMLILACERSLEIIGEAVGKIDDEFKTNHPGIMWTKIRGLRNVVAHMYWSVDYDIIWNVLTVEIPVLEKQVEGIIKNTKEDEQE